MKKTMIASSLRLVLPTIAGFLGAVLAMFYNEVFVAFCSGGGMA